MSKPIRTLILLVLALVVVGAAAYALYTKKAHSPVREQGTATQASEQVYTDEEHGYSFSYPDGYVVTEQDHVVTLVRAEDANPPMGGEGPTAITVQVIENAGSSVSDWIRTSAVSNFGLGNGEITATAVAGTNASTYTWSGLYEGRTTVFAHGDDLIAVSVTWMTPEDEQLAAYNDVLASFSFAGSGTPTPQ